MAPLARKATACHCVVALIGHAPMSQIRCPTARCPPPAFRQYCPASSRRTQPQPSAQGNREAPLSVAVLRYAFAKPARSTLSQWHGVAHGTGGQRSRGEGAVSSAGTPNFRHKYFYFKNPPRG